MAKGDVIYVQRLGYKHYGVDVGEGYVAHFRKISFSNGRIIVTSKAEFRQCAIFIYKDIMVERRFSRDEVAKRALSYSGSNFGGYDFISNNCEHFANYCASGERVSRQAFFANDDMNVIDKTLDAAVITAVDMVIKPIVSIDLMFDYLFDL
jgi:hypothetical protein